MAAYVILIRKTTKDAAEFATYGKMAPAAREGRDMKPLAFYGPLQILEGDTFEGVVILQFPDVAAAKDWYESPKYQEALQHRLAGAEYNVMIVDGVPG
jgi:uncharacterized protein (DUF1330 family)